ncbi:MAG: diguanylate cyclase [Chloroflexi bacterium]|jgi:DNA-binding response OmpR family regulator|nr:diguanylate cyclase [Chloroflexota bacterium]
MGGRILVVDDDELICDLVSETLNFEGYDVEAAYSGEQALRRLDITKPDLILLDIMMSGIDGFEVCRRVLNDQATRHIPIIFLTAKGQFEDELRGYEEGAFDYITKPFHPLSLAPTIRETLEAENKRDIEGKRQNRIEKLRSLLNLRADGEVSQRP